VAFSIISPGVEPVMATHTLLMRERRIWNAAVGTFDLMGAIAYLTEQLAWMQIFPRSLKLFDDWIVCKAGRVFIMSTAMMDAGYQEKSPRQGTAWHLLRLVNLLK
jgi:hypothetical protein